MPHDLQNEIIPARQAVDKPLAPTPAQLQNLGQNKTSRVKRLAASLSGTIKRSRSDLSDLAEVGPTGVAAGICQACASMIRRECTLLNISDSLKQKHVQCVHHDPCGLQLQGLHRQLDMWQVLPASGAECMLCWCRLAALLT